jgi:hypothetical protein
MTITERRRRSYSILLITLLTALILILSGGVDQVHAQWATNGNNINNTNTGNVGIGTTAFDTWDSGFKVLGLNTNSGFTIAAGNTSGNALHITDRAYFNGTSWIYSASSTPVSNYYQAGGTHVFRVAAGGTAGNSFTWTNALAINNNGNVGIGLTTPSNPLSVKAGVNSGILFRNAADTYTLASTTPRGSFGAGLNQGYFALYDAGAVTVALDPAGPSYFTGGNVGIGTVNPGGKLQVGDGTGFITLRVVDSTGTIAVGSQGGFMRMQTDGTNILFLNTGNAFAPVKASVGKFEGTGTSYFTGNVGIGTTNPTHTLEVNGSANITGSITGGTINATYQDVAEWVPAIHALPAGTVVVLNPSQSNQVMASTSAYDTRVAGVISEKPGLALGVAGTDKALVATTGRVKVKVDATHAPIHVGDLLVTSDVEGVAMKSMPLDLGGTPIHRPGTLIGKALEPLEKGMGEILVLLSLQ